MNHAETFKAFFEDIHTKDLAEYESDLGGVIKKLNQKYYEISDEESNRLIVGSVGRGTAVDGCSDLDVIFKMPNEEFSRYDKREGNGQSDLLQDVKKVLLEKYPKTSIKGDGQAVVISFTNKPYTIDLVPAFEQLDMSYKYPDTNNGGSWKITKPLEEQDACKIADDETNGNFIRVCNALRIWKDNVGFCFGGLLIDTLVDKYKNEIALQNATFSGYYEVLKDVFSKLKTEDPEQSYWLALGSNQQVMNSGNGAFVKKAKKAYKKMDEASTELEKENVLVELLGKRFEDCIVESGRDTQEARWSRQYRSINNEGFIEDKYPVDVRYNLELECRVEQNGFRVHFLSKMLKEKIPLRRDKKLTFFIKETNVPNPYTVLWKVRNKGEWAHKKNQIRGHLLEDTGKHERIEHTSFNGPHYVECYAIKDEICVARSRIEVPIKDDLIC